MDHLLDHNYALPQRCCEKFETIKKKKREKSHKKIFPFRLHELASLKSFQPLSWADNGTLLLVDLNTIDFYLRAICRTKNYASFLRQLHLYGFRKVGRCSPNKRLQTKLAFYRHSFFQKQYPQLLHRIERIKQ